ncbi:unnamed protein product, partial [marine sediment metagenome]
MINFPEMIFYFNEEQIKASAELGRDGNVYLLAYSEQLINDDGEAPIEEPSSVSIKA